MNDTNNNIRVRFAPSPTGYLHVGGARTALFNYLFAKRKGGKFILRIDDTDLARNTADSMKMVMDDLLWLGLKWDDGIDPITLKDMGDYGPYKQSDRLAIYMDHALKLIDMGLAYYDFGNSDDDNTDFRNYPIDDAKARIKNGDAFAIRFKISDTVRDFTFYDDIRGKITFRSDNIKDFVIIRSNGVPTYNYACAIDDHLMAISHVYRADEHLNNTLPQLMIYDAFNWTPPKFGHMSLILGKDRAKLSKRHGATSVHDFKNRGFLPSTMINFMALLGWSHPKTNKEIFDFKDLIDNFSIKKVNVAPAVFDDDKLLWMNGMYLRNMDNADLLDLVRPYLGDLDLSADKLNKALDLFKVNLLVVPDISKYFDYLRDDFKLSLDDDAKLFLKDNDNAKKVIALWRNILSTAPDFINDLDALTNDMKNTLGFGAKDLFWTLRILTIGSPHGPELKTFLTLISTKTLLKRADSLA